VTARVLPCVMRKMFAGILLALLAACHTKDNLPTVKPDDQSQQGCAAIRESLQLAYGSELKGQAEQPTAGPVADNVAMMMRECAQAPARVSACVKAHSVAAEITQLCTAPIDDAGSEGQLQFGSAQ
jgi:hypothetical protein